MIISCFLFLAIIAALVIGVAFCFRKPTRKVGVWIFGVVSSLVLMAVLISALSPRLVVDHPPLMSELVGVWKCTELSEGFKQEVKVPESGALPTIHFSKETVRGTMIPIRYPNYHWFDGEERTDISNGTPSGGYGFRIGFALFYCYRTVKGEIILRQKIDVNRYWTAEYRRVSQPG